MTWRLAPTLVQLRSEVNEEWPLRDKHSDGTLGNAAHAATYSDHNPDDRDVVCAMDFDEDLDRPQTSGDSFHPGRGAQVFVDRLLALARAGKLPQLHYIVYERQIFSSTKRGTDGKYWGANPYNGVNAHDHHAHVSVHHEARLADRTTPWGIGKPINPEEDEMDIKELREMIRDELREAIHDRELINNVGFAEGSTEGRMVTLNEALIGIRERLSQVPNAESVARAVEAAEAIEELDLNKRLTAIEAALKALAPQP